MGRIRLNAADVDALIPGLADLLDAVQQQALRVGGGPRRGTFRYEFTVARVEFLRRGCREGAADGVPLMSEQCWLLSVVVDREAPETLSGHVDDFFLTGAARGHHRQAGAQGADARATRTRAMQQQVEAGSE
jgi:hypothetical protein